MGETETYPNLRMMVRDGKFYGFEASRQEIQEALAALDAPIPMRLPCPSCGELHIDLGEFATKPHHTHACQECGMVWRPAVEATVGVRFLPGFKDETALWCGQCANGLVFDPTVNGNVVPCDKCAQLHSSSCDGQTASAAVAIGPEGGGS